MSHIRKLCRDIENYVTTQFSIAIEKLCRDIENYVVTQFSVATEKLCRDLENYDATKKLVLRQEAEKKFKKKAEF